MRLTTNGMSDSGPAICRNSAHDLARRIGATCVTSETDRQIRYEALNVLRSIEVFAEPQCSNAILASIALNRLCGRQELIYGRAI